MHDVNRCARTDRIQGLPEHRTVTDDAGSKIDPSAQLHLDDDGGRAERATVETGMVAGAESFAPLAQADTDRTPPRMPPDEDTIKDAGRMELRRARGGTDDEPADLVPVRPQSSTPGPDRPGQDRLGAAGRPRAAGIIDGDGFAF